MTYDEVDTLAHQAKAGDKTAAELLLSLLRPLALSAAKSSQAPDEPFEDALQDIYLAFLTGVRRFEGPWGFTAFIKEHLRLYRCQKQEGRYDRSVRPGVSLDQPEGEAGARFLEIPDPAARTEADYLAAERYARLSQACGSLTKAEKEILQARYHKGQTLRQIAARRGCSHMAVDRCLKRELKKLRALMTE